MLLFNQSKELKIYASLIIYTSSQQVKIINLILTLVIGAIIKHSSLMLKQNFYKFNDVN